MRFQAQLTEAVLVAMIGASLACGGPAGQQQGQSQQSPSPKVQSLALVGTITAISPKSQTVTIEQLSAVQSQVQQQSVQQKPSPDPKAAVYTFKVNAQTQLQGEGADKLKGNPWEKKKGAGSAQADQGQAVPAGQTDPPVEKKKGDPLAEPASQSPSVLETLQVGQAIAVTCVEEPCGEQKGCPAALSQAGQGQAIQQAVDQKEYGKRRPAPGQQANLLAVQIRILPAAAQIAPDAPTPPAQQR